MRITPTWVAYEALALARKYKLAGEVIADCGFLGQVSARSAADTSLGSISVMFEPREIDNCSDVDEAWAMIWPKVLAAGNPNAIGLLS